MAAAEGAAGLWLHSTSPAAHSSSTVRKLVRASGAVSRTRCSSTSCRGPRCSRSLHPAAVRRDPLRAVGLRYGVGIKDPPGRAASDPATAARRRMTRDRLGPFDGAARAPRTDRGGELGRPAHVLVGSSRLVPLPAASPHLGVGEALVFGTLDRFGLGEDALALIALA